MNGYASDSSHEGDSDIGRRHGSMGDLIETRCRELEARNLEMVKAAVDAERKRKALEVKYESSLQDQIRMQMKVIHMLCGQLGQPKKKET